ncbi:MAG TPA: hypothetical protein VKM72_04200 [Thermoanaerobaculia bacterium]|nr:hypothetical protein [Thermoanaerobaculia bacterium]
MEPVNLSPVVQVTATFNPASAEQRLTFSTDAPIDFSTARGTVTITLDVQTVLPVRFPSNPIQWVRKDGVDPDGNDILVPIAPPEAAMVSRNRDDSVTVTVTRPPGSPGESTTFRFYVVVQSFLRDGRADGRFFGSDPTIVTMHPEGG